MCGIAGFSISDKDHRFIESRYLSRCLLKQIIERGRDATGAAWSENTDNGLEVWYTKAAVPATEFLDALQEMPRYTRSAILHTRYATQGDPSNNDNNHPIVVPNVVGVHNGVIVNDDFIFDKLGCDRLAQVDSEAIFRLIAEHDNPLPHLHKLRGRAAIAWFKADDPSTLHIARLEGSPLHVGQTRHGSLVFASTYGNLTAATRASNTPLVETWQMDEWSYMAVRKGVIHEFAKLDMVAA